MDSFNWRCDCGEVINGIGLMSLSLAISNHKREKHGVLLSMSIEEILRSPQYWKETKPAAQPQYTTPNALCSGKDRPTYLEHQWLAKGLVKWDGDNRTPEELATRYKDYGTA